VDIGNAPAKFCVCSKRISKDWAYHAKWSKKRGKRKAVLSKYRDQLLAKPTPSQAKALEYTRKISYLFFVKPTPERIFGSYIIDIYLKKLMIGIEIDGGIHSKQLAYDDQRDEYLASCGVTIVRFTNQEVRSGFFQKALWHSLNEWYVEKHYKKILTAAKECGVSI
jgi:very-short-patch-repair endonuclease